MGRKVQFQLFGNGYKGVSVRVALSKQIKLGFGGGNRQRGGFRRSDGQCKLNIDKNFIAQEVMNM